MKVPSDLVTVGHVLDAWRLDGSVKVAPYAGDASAMLGAKAWWLDVKGTMRSLDVIDAKAHGNTVTARFVGVVDRDMAEQLKGARISISRRHFAVTADDEYYWVDLIGLAVVNGAGELLGEVTDLMDNGAHQNLVVRETMVDGKAIERVIPFVDAHVASVDLQGRRIVVDWQKDY